MAGSEESVQDVIFRLLDDDEKLEKAAKAVVLDALESVVDQGSGTAGTDWSPTFLSNIKVSGFRGIGSTTKLDLHPAPDRPPLRPAFGGPPPVRSHEDPSLEHPLMQSNTDEGRRGQTHAHKSGRVEREELGARRGRGSDGFCVPWQCAAVMTTSLATRDPPHSARSASTRNGNSFGPDSSPPTIPGLLSVPLASSLASSSASSLSTSSASLEVAGKG